MERTTDTINGIPVDQYGMWCKHGTRIMVADPADQSDYPGLVFTDPWPCDQGCSIEQISREMDEEAAEYEADRWREYWDMCAGGLTTSAAHYTDDRSAD